MKFRDIDVSNSPLNAEQQRLGIALIEQPIEKLGLGDSQSRSIRAAVWLTTSLLVVLSGYLLVQLLGNGVTSAQALVSEAINSPLFWSAVAVGLLAQAVDGALGMAYGVTSTSFLMASGVSPAMASASVHVAEVFTTGVSGVAHAKLGNVDKKLFFKLLIPGISGAVIGGLFAVPFAALLCRKLHSHALLLLVGTLISAVSVFNLYSALV